MRVRHTRPTLARPAAQSSGTDKHFSSFSSFSARTSGPRIRRQYLSISHQNRSVLALGVEIKEASGVESEPRRRVDACPRGALLLCLMALAGCGSSATASQRLAARERTSARRAEASQALARRRQRIVAEVSDVTPYSTCEQWLSTSEAARDAYLLKNWPHLHRQQVTMVVHQQSLGCQAVPHTHRRTSMDPLQAAVYLVVLGFEHFYEETLAVGIKESVVHYDARALGLRFAPPPRAPTLRRRL
jgi:hypothetical protein